MTTAEYKALAAQYGSPLYLFDEAVLADRVAAARQILGPAVKLCYSIKANPFILPAMARLLDRIEVCSPGELIVCEMQKLPMQQVVFSGVNKTRPDVDRALADKVGVFTAESPLHLRHISDAAQVAGVTVPVLLRLSSGNQFGMDEETLTKLVHDQAAYPGTELVGIHYFSGTQKKKPAVIEKELARLGQFFQSLADEHGFAVQRLEYGPGLGVDYFGKDGGVEGELELLRQIAPALQALAAHYELTVEMGRWFAARCGSFVTAVADVKHSAGVNYAILDGGIHQLNYYGQTMAMQLPPILHLPVQGTAAPARAPGKGETDGWTLCGSLCTVADVLVRQAQFEQPLQMGDLLVFGCCGAYSMTEAPALFLTRELPAVLLRQQNGEICLLRQHISPAFLNCGAENC